MGVHVCVKPSIPLRMSYGITRLKLYYDRFCVLQLGLQLLFAGCICEAQISVWSDTTLADIFESCVIDLLQNRDTTPTTTTRIW